MHSPKYDMVAEFYRNGRWSIQRVRDAVGRWITAEEYQQITGEPYISAM